MTTIPFKFILIISAEVELPPALHKRLKLKSNTGSFTIPQSSIGQYPSMEALATLLRTFDLCWDSGMLFIYERVPGLDDPALRHLLLSPNVEYVYGMRYRVIEGREMVALVFSKKAGGRQVGLGWVKRMFFCIVVSGFLYWWIAVLFVKVCRWAGI
jgi:hypothetical protein